jgi:hypothetical protein
MYDYNTDDNVGVDAASYSTDAVGMGRRIIKRRMRRHMQKEAQKQQAKAAAEATKETAKVTERTVEGIVKTVAENPVVLIILGVFLVVAIMYHCMKVEMLSLLGSMTESVVAGSYTAYEEDILGVEADYIKLEKLLKKTIDRTEQDYPEYDEYEYQLEEIGHNPTELISYLTVVYEDFNRREMKEVIKGLFNEQYDLTYIPRTETRTRTVTKYGIRNGRIYSYEDTEEYTVKILKVKLNNKGLNSVIHSRSLSAVQKERYLLLLQTQGNHPDLFNDIYTDEEIPEDLGVAPEALTDQTFAAMITEGEKYLGRAYVWGGSNPSQGFDCSGFVCWVLNHSGWSVGRTDCNGLKAKCTVVSEDEARPGDLIFFKGTQRNRRGATHVGIYCGNGTMLHCGNPIQYTSVRGRYYREHFLCYGRLP